MKTLVADCIAANERPGILDTSVAEGYPYADVEQMGMAWVAIADGDLDAARDAARWMAGRAWSHREALNTPVAVGRAKRSTWRSGAIAARARSATSTRCRPTARRSRPRPRGPPTGSPRVPGRSC